MKVLCVMITACVALTTASVMRKRQDAPPSPTSPPVAVDTTVVVVDSGSSSAPVSSMAPDTDAPAQAPSSTMADDTTPMPTTQMPTTQMPTTEEPTTQAPTTPEPTTQEPTTQEPTTQEPTTPEPTTPKPTKIAEVDEILSVFKDTASTQYFKRLSIEDQILLMEILSGGESGKITLVLKQIGFENLFAFVEEIPLKYFEGFLAFIRLGYEREHHRLDENN